MIKHITLVAVISLCCANSHSQTYSSNGMVVSDNLEASKVGIEILKKGGNAIDASIATAFALAVAHPQAGNIGGGGFMVYMDDSSRVTTIDFREMAPVKASSTMFLDENGELIKGKNHVGALSAGVPGTVAGLYLAHQKYGKLPWEDLLIGFQCRVWRNPNTYNANFWYHFTNIYTHSKNVRSQTNCGSCEKISQFFDNNIIKYNQKIKKSRLNTRPSFK